MTDHEKLELGGMTLSRHNGGIDIKQGDSNVHLEAADLPEIVYWIVNGVPQPKVVHVVGPIIWA